MNLPTNPNSEFIRLLREWTLKQQSAQKEDDKKQQAYETIAAQLAAQLASQQQQQNMAQLSHQAYMNSQMQYLNAYPSYGMQGLGGGSLGGYISASSSAPYVAPPDPTLTLKAQIAQLQSTTPAKVTSRAPDFCQTLVAWRGWQTNGDKLIPLGSGTSNGKAWEPKKARPAKCTMGKSHVAPQRDCTCGFWSFRSLDLLTEALRGYTSAVTVLGQVEIWGRVVECENGYRSEFACPKELWLLKPDLEGLSWQYDVPIRKFEREEEK